MSRAGLYGSLIAACAAALVGCGPKNEVAGFFGAKTPITVDITCGGKDLTIRLTDESGNSAWVVETVDREIRWKPTNHVKINGILAKPNKDLPIDRDPGENGGSEGRPFKAKVKAENAGGPQDGVILPYAIDATCRSGNKEFRLLIDPEMIVR